jgi:hypothetical protein
MSAAFRMSPEQDFLLLIQNIFQLREVLLIRTLLGWQSVDEEND